MRKLPDLCRQYAILKREQRDLSDDDGALKQIEENAQRYGRQRKMEDKGRDQIRAIFRQLDQFDQEMTAAVLRGLGVEVLWVDDYDVIPDWLREIGGGA